jgi:hypothetical protein
VKVTITGIKYSRKCKWRECAVRGEKVIRLLCFYAQPDHEQVKDVQTIKIETATKEGIHLLRERLVRRQLVGKWHALIELGLIDRGG